MIITLKGANFSANNIGILNGYFITMLLSGVSCSSTATTIGAGKPFSATFTLDAGSSYKSSKIMMGEDDITASLIWNNEKTSATLTIDAVYGDLTIDIKASIALTTANAVNHDTANHLATMTNGAPISNGFYQYGTKGILTWNIPAKARVTLQVSSGGSYGMAITDMDDIVLEWTQNSTILTNNAEGIYTFGVYLFETKLHVSTTKFVSASYEILSDEQIADLDFPVRTTLSNETGKYVSPSQTTGTPVAFSEMSSTGYYVSEVIPANTQVTVTVISGGSYGNALCDTNGNVLESLPNNKANEDSKVVFAPQSIETVLYASKNKFTSATYKFV